MSRRLDRDERGATITEFGFVIIPLCIVLMGLMDLGFRVYVGAVLQGALQQAARSATTGNTTTTALDSSVTTRMADLVASKYISISRKSYYSFSRVGKAEKLITDKNSNGKYDTGDCYEDANANSTYDTDGGASGIGGSDDILYYQVTATFPRLFPLSKLLGWTSTQSVTSNTVIRNQPYASQSTPTTVCN